MFRVKTKANFSFSKLSRNISNIIKETKTDIGEKTITSMRNIIKEAPYKKLTDIRKRQRAKNVGFPDTNTGVSNRGGDTPLEQSGKLYDSMKYTGKGIHMNHYGLTHNDGVPDDIYPNLDPPVGKPVNMIKRPFIKIGMERTDLKDIEKNYYNKIEKNFKK